MNLQSHHLNKESLPVSDAIETSKTTTSPFSFSTSEESSPTHSPETDAIAKLMKTVAVCTSSPFNTRQDDFSWDDAPAQVPALVAANVDQFQFLTMSIQEIRHLLLQQPDP